MEDLKTHDFFFKWLLHLFWDGQGVLNLVLLTHQLVVNALRWVLRGWLLHLLQLITSSIMSRWGKWVYCLLRWLSESHFGQIVFCESDNMLEGLHLIRSSLQVICEIHWGRFDWGCGLKISLNVYRELFDKTLESIGDCFGGVNLLLKQLKVPKLSILLFARRLIVLFWISFGVYFWGERSNNKPLCFFYCNLRHLREHLLSIVVPSLQ